MSKIICDVCGTSYPDTATQCPICGCVRSADVEAVVTGDDAAGATVGSTYTYVKGGRFSKANVKKRNSGKPVVTAAAPTPAPVKAAAPAKTAAPAKATAPKAEPVEKTPAPAKQSSASGGQKSNIGLIIVIIVLLFAIIAVLSYIAIRFVVPSVFGEDGGNSITEYVPVPDAAPGSATEPDADVPCTAMELSDVEVYLTTVGDTYSLTVTTDPEDTTDEVLFASDDDSIATVDEDGLITAVAEGETIVTVTCGTQSEMCRVVCEFADESADGELVLDAESYTLSKKGETWTCYTGTIDVSQITWTSDNDEVATISNGVVTAVGTGTTTIRAQYNDTEVTCEIICEDSVNSTTEDSSDTDPTQPTESTQPTDQTTPANANYEFNTHDKNEMMLNVGESFSLRLCDENGKALTGVKYSSSNDAVCTVSEKGTVKCIAYGATVYISAEYNGAVYKCKVYVR